MFFLFRFCLITLVTIVAGCALPVGRVGLPVERELVSGPLVMHSDFLLPSQHPVVGELKKLKLDLEQQLEISVSSDPVDVYLFSSQKRFRRFLKTTYPSFPDRRAFFVKRPDSMAVFASWGSRSTEDLRHEVTHAYLHGAVSELPLWLDEGIAEFFEVGPHANGVNRPHIRLLAEAWRAGTWAPSIERLEQMDSALAMNQLEYAESWLWVHYLLNGDAHTRSILCNSLSEQNATVAQDPISVQIREWIPDCDQGVIGHLKQLADGS